MLFVLALLSMNLFEILQEINDINNLEQRNKTSFTAAVVEIEVETSELCKNVRQLL